MRRILTDERGFAPILIVVFVILGVILIAVVGAAVVLADNVSMTITNHTNSTLDVAKEVAALNLNFLPGFELPSQIAPGETAVIQIPKRLVESVTIANSSIQVRAFSQQFAFGTSSIDMQRSTLDGASMSGFIGRQIDLKKDHTVVLASR
jgi:hypothetical protein